jgi:enoyl-CoA hydratase/carnithine racemase
MIEDGLVLCEISEGVALLTLNRPDRLNAWTVELEARYFDLLRSAADNPEVRVIVVTGAGRGFCAGLDAEALGEVAAKGKGEGFQDPSVPLSIPKPIIAAINGSVAGIGLLQALMCDIRFAAAGAKFTTAFARRGLVAEQGISWLLTRLVGQANALDLLLSARTVLAEEAAEMGLVNKVVAADTLLDHALDYARDMAANCSPASMAAIKAQVYGDLQSDLGAALAESARRVRISMGLPDFREGLASFAERRAPQFPTLPPGE